MKKAGLLFFLVSMQCMAAAPNFAKLNVDWNSKSSTEVFVQQCDDSYYDGVGISVPGRSGKDFRVEMNVDVTYGKISAGCSILNVKESDGYTEYFFSAESSCEVTFTKVRRSPKILPVKPKVFSLSSSC